MVESEAITFEKIELSLEEITLSDLFNQSAIGTDNSSESPQIQAVDPNNISKPQV